MQYPIADTKSTWHYRRPLFQGPIKLGKVPRLYIAVSIRDVNGAPPTDAHLPKHARIQRHRRLQPELISLGDIQYSFLTLAHFDNFLILRVFLWV